MPGPNIMQGPSMPYWNRKLGGKTCLATKTECALRHRRRRMYNVAERKQNRMNLTTLEIAHKLQERRTPSSYHIKKAMDAEENCGLAASSSLSRSTSITSSEHLRPRAHAQKFAQTGHCLTKVACKAIA